MILALPGYIVNNFWFKLSHDKVIPESSTATNHLFCFVSRIYGPVNTIKVMLSRAIKLSTLFLGRLPKRLSSTKCPYFHQ